MKLGECAGKTAVITGAASGIGASLAREAATRGMNLMLVDVDEAGLKATAASCLGAASIVNAKVDVSCETAMAELAENAFQRFGEVALLCNNAGVVPGGRQRPVWEFDAKDWRWAFDVNVIGLANGLRGFVPRMISTGVPAHILNTTSISGFISGAGSPVYGASKHAAVRLTEALYASLLEVGADIGVSMLCPGLVNTRIFESERHRPERLSTSMGDHELPADLEGIASQGADPDAVARAAFAGMEQGRFYILTTEAFDQSIAQRTDAILARRNPVFESFVAMSTKDAGGAAKEVIQNG